jgi:hypothetical protein
LKEQLIKTFCNKQDEIEAFKAKLKEQLEIKYNEIHILRANSKERLNTIEALGNKHDEIEAFKAKLKEQGEIKHDEINALKAKLKEQLDTIKASLKCAKQSQRYLQCLRIFCLLLVFIVLFSSGSAAGPAALIHLLHVGWRNYFSSCAVVSVFGSGGK